MAHAVLYQDAESLLQVHDARFLINKFTTMIPRLAACYSVLSRYGWVGYSGADQMGFV
jgi:hypothetical protein